MKANDKFISLPNNFWASVRMISEVVGYTSRKRINRGQVLIPEKDEIRKAFVKRGLDYSEIISNQKEKFTDFGILLSEYFVHRADILNNYVEPRLMNLKRAKSEFHKVRKTYNPTIPVPMNKQKGEKKAPAYFTGIVNGLIERYAQGELFDHDPKQLTTITKNQRPYRTLARRVDGAFPSTVNPIAIWEIKEYYYTTTFGSRVADGVYETLLDGLELQELYKSANIKVLHYLMIDDYFTWWVKGKSYLCRLIDMLHMGIMDEVLFGYEVVERLPEIVNSWITN